MALYAWRLQADIPKGELDPMVTVFLGPERAILDDKGDPTGDTFVEQSTANPEEMKLSDVAGFLAGPIVRKTKSPAPGLNMPSSPDARVV